MPCCEQADADNERKQPELRESRGASSDRRHGLLPRSFLDERPHANVAVEGCQSHEPVTAKKGRPRAPLVRKSDPDPDLQQLAQDVAAVASEGPHLRGPAA